MINLVGDRHSLPLVRIGEPVAWKEFHRSQGALAKTRTWENAVYAFVDAGAISLAMAPGTPFNDWYFERFVDEDQNSSSCAEEKYS